MSYPHHTRCAAPGDSHSWDTGSNLWAIFLAGLAGSSAGGLIFMLIESASIDLCTGGIAVLVALGVYAYQFKNWYYNHRLMCIDEERCIIGTMVGNAHVSFDGDTKFDMLIAPFTVGEVHRYIIEELNVDTDEFGTGPGGDGYDIGNIGAVHNYIEEFMTEEQRIELYSRVVHRRMFTGDAERDYLKHFLIRDEAVMGAEAYEHSPLDRYPPVPRDSGVNPMYRSSHTPTDWLDNITGGSDLSETLLPFLHCELEGNYMNTLLDNIALTALLGAGIIGSMCYVPFPWNLIAVAVLALIILLIWIFNGDEHDDSNPEDAGLDRGDADREAVALEGDVFVIYGDWIMDEEHTKYFELHPIRAVHFLLKNNSSYNVQQELYEGAESYDVSKILADDWRDICGMVSKSEKSDTDSNKTVGNAKAYAMMAGFA